MSKADETLRVMFPVYNATSLELKMIAEAKQQLAEELIAKKINYVLGCSEHCPNNSSKSVEAVPVDQIRAYFGIGRV